MNNLKYLILTLLLASTANALEIGYQECKQLSVKMAVNPRLMTIADLDTLKLCINQQMDFLIKEQSKGNIEKAVRPYSRRLTNDWE